MLYTADGVGIENGTLPELPVGLNFGPGERTCSLRNWRKNRPNVPPFAANIGMAGSTTGAKARHRRCQKPADELKWMLAQGYS